MSIVVGEIYAMLFSRAVPGTFHWVIGVGLDSRNVMKLHATQRGASIWFFEYPPPRHDVLQSQTVAAVIKIGMSTLSIQVSVIISYKIQAISSTRVNTRQSSRLCGPFRWLFLLSTYPMKPAVLLAVCGSKKPFVASITGVSFTARTYMP